MKLIIGLGNPGKEYERTRHNTGFMVLDHFADKMGESINQSKFKGLYTKMKYRGEDIILLKPQTFMNLSGEVVRRYADYFKINIDDILVISDDLDLPFLKYRLRLFGSCGGHNGIRNIETCLKSNRFKRFRIGISGAEGDAVSYVLGKFSKDDIEKIEKFLPITYDILNDFCKIDFERLMSKYN